MMLMSVFSHSLLGWYALTKWNLITWAWMSFQLFKKSIIHAVCVFLNSEEIFTFVRKDRRMTPDASCSEWLYEMFNHSFSNTQFYTCGMYSLLIFCRTYSLFLFITCTLVMWSTLLSICLDIAYTEYFRDLWLHHMLPWRGLCCQC